MEGRIRWLKGKVANLVSNPLQSFETSDVEQTPGIYAIYDENGSIIYVGKSSKLRRRIMSNHRSGNSRGSAFRRALMEKKGVKDRSELSAYIRKKCSFRYLHVNKDELSTVEHFSIAVLNPSLNK